MRRLTAICAAAALLAAGCSGDDQGDEGSDKVSGRIRVQVSGGESEIAAYKKLAAAFHKSHPGTKVDIVAVAEQGDHIAKLGTAFAGRNPPDVFLINYRRYGQFVERGVIEPMGDHLGPLEVGDMHKPATDAFTHDGKLQCLPQNASSLVVYVNPGLFAKAKVPLPKAGWTVDDLTRTVDALFDKGVERAIGFEPSIRTLAPFVWAADGEIVDDHDKPTRIALGSAPARQALERLIALQRKGVDATDRAAADAEERFSRGEVAMFIDSRRAVPGLRKAKLRFDVVPLPADRQGATLLASDAYCVSKAGKNKPLAYEFARYAVGPDGGKVLAATGRTVPSLKALAEGPAFLDPAQPPKAAKVWLDVLPTARRLPSVAPWHEAEEVASDILEQVFAGKLSVDAAIDKIEADTARVFAQQR